MDVSFARVEQILKTLPIGYYCGRDIKVNLSKQDATYYDFSNDCIRISYPMIQRSTTLLTDDSKVENDVRCLLYHEVSHAILTPSNIRADDFYNVFEDERIETILQDYYMGVNFKEFVKRINNFKDEAPHTADEYFYQIVRFRKGPEKFTTRVKTIIDVYQNAFKQLYNYCDDVENLYFDIVDDWNNNRNNAQNIQNNENNNESDDKSQRGIAQSSETFDTSDAQIETGNSLGAGKSAGRIKKLVSDCLNRYVNGKINDEIEKILSSVKKSSKSNGSAINAYSGVFNPRSVARNDYKYFVQQNRNGHIRAFSKLHLNLFIDESSSFRDNDSIVNTLLYGLGKIERSYPDFSFTLISCGIGQRIRDKNDRFQRSHTGTRIKDTIFEQYRQVQEQDAENINIVLYDGSACWVESDALNFKAFDNKHSVLIVDDSNKLYMKHCKNAKVIITQNYTYELEKNVLDALKILTKI